MSGFLLKRKNKIIVLLISIFILAGFFYFGLFLFSKKYKPEYAIIDFGPYKLKSEIARDTIKMQKGLSGRNTISENEGMLFEFKERGIYSFWMKDMNFPIDIVWIDGNQITDISRNLLPPESTEIYSRVYKPSKPVNLVLEIKAGLAEKINLKNGQKINIEYLK